MLLNPTNVHDVFRVLEILQKILGLQLVFRKPNKLWKKVFSLMYLLVTFLVYSVVYITMAYVEVISYDYWVMTIMCYIIAGVQFFEPILAIAFGLAFESKQHTILNDLDRFDYEVLWLRSCIYFSIINKNVIISQLKRLTQKTVNHNRQQLAISVYLLGYFLVSLILLLIGGYNSWKWLLISMYNGLHLTTVGAMFIFITLTTCSRFQLLNLTLR